MAHLRFCDDMRCLGDSLDTRYDIVRLDAVHQAYEMTQQTNDNAHDHIRTQLSAEFSSIEYQSLFEHVPNHSPTGVLTTPWGIFNQLPKKRKLSVRTRTVRANLSSAPDMPCGFVRVSYLHGVEPQLWGRVLALEDKSLELRDSWWTTSRVS